MKTRNIFGILLLFLYIVSFVSCNNDEIEERKITDCKEYALTVASEKLPGIATSCGNSYLTEVYAVKKGDSKDWEALLVIAGFEYKPGYEYTIRISETSYLDYNMGEPAWTERALLEIISEEKKNSEDLPLHFIPKCCIDEQSRLTYTFAIEADSKEKIEEDVMTNSILPFKSHCFVYFAESSRKWIFLNDENSLFEKGIIKTASKKPEEMPEAYKILPPKGQVLSGGEWTFLDEFGEATSYPVFDVFIANATKTSDVIIPKVVYLYKDLTNYYQSKYPEANVRAVVICYEVSI